MRMPMLRFLYRKMWNTKWLTLCTLAGLMVAVSFTTSIPMYADGALKRVVSKSLEQNDSGLPPGSVLIRYQAAGREKTNLDSLHDVDGFINKDVPKRIGFPFSAYSASFSLKSTQIYPVDDTKVDPSKRRQMNLATFSGLEKKAEISIGRMYSNRIDNGVIEAVVLEDGLYKNDFQIGDEFTYPVDGMAPLRIKVVGSYKPKDETDPYWYQGLDSAVNSLVISDAVFQNDLLERKKIPLGTAEWYYAFDLSDIQTSQLSPVSKTLERLDSEVYQKMENTRMEFSFQPMLDDFKKQSTQLQMLLFTLAAPMIAMVFYFIAMMARQSLERQRSDIAVLRSRGGSTRQIIRIYLLEGTVLGGISLLTGPFIGWFMAKSIGASNGFLEFVNRKAVPVGVTKETILYGAVAVVIAVIASLIPAIVFARASIVGLKQQLARADRKPLWQRWYLDIALLALSGYGWYSFNENQLLSLRSGLSSDQMQIQPLLFFVPALAIFSMGLFFLRIFPWLLRLFNWLGRKMLPVPLYLTLTQLSRSAKSYYPLMLLLILTLGLGVYNSSAARTIDLNSVERTLYEYGSDVIIEPVWEAFTNDLPEKPPADNGGGPGQGSGGGGGNQNPGGGSGGGQGQGGNGGGGAGGPGGPGGGQDKPSQVFFREPPFEIFRQLPGVKHAARVLKTKANVVVAGRSKGTGLVMGIDNVDFAEVGWFREDLYPYKSRSYFQLLGTYEQAVLIPSDFAKENQIKLGDPIKLAINQQTVDFNVVAIVPYWPSQYPKNMPFFITNLDYIYDQVPLMPYEVWLKMKDGAKTTPVLNELQKQDIAIASVKDVRIQLAQDEKHPSRGGVFGILSLGFLVSVMVSFVGYVLYWFFNLSSRIVQFGVLRAMGLSRKQLTGMLLLEQVFTAGLSIGLGIGIGKLAGLLFLPFLQTTGDAGKQVPPFRVIFEARDTYQLYAVVLVMMAIGAALLFLHIRRLRVHQAVKMGEER